MSTVIKSLLVLSLMSISATAVAEYSIGMPGAEGTAGFTGKPSNPTLQGNTKPTQDNSKGSSQDRKYNEKIDKISKTVEGNYKKLNDGRQEEYDRDITQMLRAMQRDIDAGGDGHLYGEAEKFIEAEMDKLEDDDD